MRGQSGLSSGDRMRRLEEGYLRYAAYGFLLLFFYVLQMTPRLLPTIAGGRPLLLIPAIVCVGMFTNPLTGGICGAVTGFVWDMFASHAIGLNALYLLAVGCACGLLVQLLMRNNILSALLLSTAATALQLLGDWLIDCVLWRLPGSGQVLLQQALPNFLYTVALSLPVYYLTLRVAKRLKLSR
ncbi:MAG: rod shape-determining protein MreD [Clostridia bacterium]|nr:rod shape-determining protein MreD [Clostridia bacterium]